MVRSGNLGIAIVGQPAVAKERADAVRNRARILAATRKIMRRRQLDEICMDEVAHLAGVGKGTLYRHFADRSALLLAVLDDDERALQDAALSGFGLPRSATAEERLHALWRALVDFHLDHARVLAVAEATAKPFARFDNPPYAWRHGALVRGLEACGVAGGARAAQLADVALMALSGEAVQRAVEREGVDGARQSVLALLSTLLGARPRIQA